MRHWICPNDPSHATVDSMQKRDVYLMDQSTPITITIGMQTICSVCRCGAISVTTDELVDYYTQKAQAKRTGPMTRRGDEL